MGDEVSRVAHCETKCRIYFNTPPNVTLNIDSSCAGHPELIFLRSTLPGIIAVDPFDERQGS